MTEELPFFSVSIPTRDRPDGLNAALRSVLSQSFPGIEVIVVDDGTRPELRGELDSMATEVHDHYGEMVRWIHLPRRAKGHGHPYARNTAASAAHGTYLATLDDDDVWFDTDHLARAHATLTAGDVPPLDIYLTDQAAFVDGKIKPGPIWIEDLGLRLKASGRRPPDGAYRITVAEATSAHGFAHLNNMIYRREFYLDAGGMDEGLRYEPDRDLYMRLVDVAAGIAYRPEIISHHFVPDPTKMANVSTQSSVQQKLLYQMYVDRKLITFARTDPVRRHGRWHLAICLKKLSESFAADGRYREAAFYAREVCLLDFFPKWLAFTAYLQLRALLAD